MTRRHDPGPGSALGPIELLEHLPGQPFATSTQLQWASVQAHRYQEQPPNEVLLPPLTHHSLLLFFRTPKEFEVESDVIRRVDPPPPGSIMVVPAGGASRWRWGMHSDSLHVLLEPDLVARVAAEAFDLDPARVSLPPLYGLHHPNLRAALLAVHDELMGRGAGGPLAVEALAHLLAVHLIRQAAAPRPPIPRSDGALPRGKLRAVVEYVEAHLDAGLTLGQMAAAAHLSAYHFARQFKAATGLAPHQYVIARRVERAQHLLRERDDLSLAQVAADAGFSDQSHFSRHFKRVIGLTPSQFRLSARIG